MSKSITIRAADSALAMDEVVRQLGADALILSTKRRNGMVEIVATTEEDLNAANAAPVPRSVPETAPLSEADTAPKASPLLETSASTFEALLKRRLQEERVDRVVSDPIDLEALRESLRPEPDPNPAPAPQPEARAVEPTPLRDPDPVRKPLVFEAPEAKDISHEPRVIGLGAFDIPIATVPPHVLDAVRDDLDYYDRSHQLIGLSKAIVSSIIPDRTTESLGAGRFWLAGADMRQKALAAIRLAIRKLDAGEAKPSFYVMGQEARADAAFLASKAELLGLSVSLVDESVGRNLPDNVPGSQIVLLPDNTQKARAYAERFQHDGDKGLLVVPTAFGRRSLAKLLEGWAGLDVQLMLNCPEYESVPAELVACLLQFNWQVGWVSEGEKILENLSQVDADTVIGWMRKWGSDSEAETSDGSNSPMFPSRQIPVRHSN